MQILDSESSIFGFGVVCVSSLLMIINIWCMHFCVSWSLLIGEYFALT